MACVSVTMPVTLEAAENDPILSGRSRYRISSSSSRAMSMWPSASSGMTTTSAIDSRHGSSLEWCSNGPMNTTGRCSRGIWRGEAVRVVELGRDADAEDADQLVDGAGRAGAGEDDHGLVVAADRVADDLAGVLAQPGGLQAGAGGLGVGVGVPGQHLVADEVLDEGQRPPGRGVVGVGDPARPERAPHHLVVADDAVADAADQAGSAGGASVMVHYAGRALPRSVRVHVAIAHVVRRSAMPRSYFFYGGIRLSPELPAETTLQARGGALSRIDLVGGTTVRRTSWTGCCGATPSASWSGTWSASTGPVTGAAGDRRARPGRSPSGRMRLPPALARGVGRPQRDHPAAADARASTSTRGDGPGRVTHRRNERAFD